MKCTSDITASQSSTGACTKTIWQNLGPCNTFQGTAVRKPGLQFLRAVSLHHLKLWGTSGTAGLRILHKQPDAALQSTPPRISQALPLG